MALLRPIHGSVKETTALVMRLLAPGLLGLSEVGGGGGGEASKVAAGGPSRQGLAVRDLTLEFVREVLSRTYDATEAVGALARHLVLKVPDKADFRALAVDSAVALIAALPSTHQQQFVIFAARLSKTPKVVPTPVSTSGLHCGTF